MIKERPASMVRVVLAFVGTAVFALLPLLLIAISQASTRAAVADAFTPVGGSALLVGVATVLIVAVLWFVTYAARRKPHVANA